MVDDKIIEKVAKTSRISLGKTDFDRLKDDFDEVLTIFKKIDEAEVDEQFSIGLANTEKPFRDDITCNKKTSSTKSRKKSLLDLSPHKKADFFKGPRCFE
ncbi:MAG: Asp-tRNA(Asn)/Glu-tRNA(Gln) amidotransferase subunit GatC [Nanoarchaeota archaeon]